MARRKKPAISVESIMGLAAQLSDAELDELIMALIALQEVRDAVEAEEEAETPTGKESEGRKRGRSARIEWKLINGCGPYAYLRFFSEGRYRSYYIGKVREEEGT